MSIEELSDKIFYGTFNREMLLRLLKKYVVMKEDPPEKVVEFKLTKIRENQ